MVLKEREGDEGVEWIRGVCHVGILSVVAARRWGVGGCMCVWGGVSHVSVHGVRVCVRVAGLHGCAVALGHGSVRVRWRVLVCARVVASSFLVVECGGCGSSLRQCVGQVVAHMIVVCFHVGELHVAIAMSGSAVAQCFAQVVDEVAVLSRFGCGRGSVERVH